MPTNRNPNPNGTSNLTGWSKGGSATTLTATADGARWVGGSSGTGRYIKVRVNTQIQFAGSFRVGNLAVRRNSGTARLTKTVISDKTYPDTYTYTSSLTNFALGSEFVTFGTMPFGYPVSSVADSNNDCVIDIFIYAEDSKPFDFTIKGLGVYDNGDSPAPPDLDANDSDWTYTQANNSLTVTTRYVVGNEAADTCTWQWGDGTANTSVAASTGTVNHTFPAPGVYSVRMTATGRYGADGTNSNTSIVDSYTSAYKTITVPVGPLTAGFTYETDFLNVVVDASATIAPSLSPIDTYAWNWGDGTSTAANASKYASHSYAAPGTYNVTLTVKDNATNRTDTEVKPILVTAAPNPDNYFVATKDLLKVAFVPSIQDGTSYAWNFGDGQSDTVKEPVHTYDGPGTYTVTLTVNGTLTASQLVTVTDVYTPLGSLNEALRLEVAIPYPLGTPYNRIKNPSGELGAWGWVTPLTNSYATGSATSDKPADKGVSGAKIIYRSSGAGTQVIYSSAVKVAVGQYATCQLQVPYVDGYYRATLEVLDAAGAVIGTSATTGFQTASPTATVRTTPYLIPSGTTSARMRINHYSNTSSGTPTVGKILQFRRAMLATGPTSASVTTLAYSEGSDWQDLIGPTSSISVGRSALDVGTFSATVLDSTFDPATSGTIRPGQEIRLRVKTQDTSGNLQWVSIYTGTVNEADVTYVAVKGAEPGPKATQIKITSSDAVTALTRSTEPRGVAKIDELPELLEGAGVPFEINGATGQVPVAQIVSFNTNASVLDQVAIARDTDGGYAYVDKDNVLQAREPAYMPTVAVGVIDEKAFSDVAASFNTAECINSVTIKWLRYTPATGTGDATVEEITYGPYEDAASVEEWGLRPATFTMQGVENPTAIAAKAAEILAANAQPARMITSVRLPIRYVEDLVPNRALLDLYDLVRLGYERTGTDELARVTSITHTITPRKWTMTLGFSAEGTVASPQTVAPPPSSLQSDNAWRVVGSTGNAQFGAGWGAYPSAPWGSVRYKKDAVGNVHIEGLANGGANGTTVFTLPVGFRPSQHLMELAICSATPGFARVDFQSDGAVVYRGATTLGTTAASYVAIGRVFPADQ